MANIDDDPILADFDAFIGSSGASSGDPVIDDFDAFTSSMGDAGGVAGSEKTRARLAAIEAKGGDVFALPWQRLQSDPREAVPVWERKDLTPTEQATGYFASSLLRAAPLARHVARRTLGGEVQTDFGDSTLANIGERVVDTGIGLGASVGEAYLGGRAAGLPGLVAATGAMTASDAALMEQQKRNQRGEAAGSLIEDLKRGVGIEASGPEDTGQARALRAASVPLSMAASLIGANMSRRLTELVKEAGGAVTPEVVRQAAKTIFGGGASNVVETIVQKAGQGDTDFTNPAYWADPAFSFFVGALAEGVGARGDIAEGGKAGDIAKGGKAVVPETDPSAMFRTQRAGSDSGLGNKVQVPDEVKKAVATAKEGGAEQGGDDYSGIVNAVRRAMEEQLKAREAPTDYYPELPPQGDEPVPDRPERADMAPEGFEKRMAEAVLRGAQYHREGRPLDITEAERVETNMELDPGDAAPVREAWPGTREGADIAQWFESVRQDEAEAERIRANQAPIGPQKQRLLPPGRTAETAIMDFRLMFPESKVADDKIVAVARAAYSGMPLPAFAGKQLREFYSKTRGTRFYGPTPKQPQPAAIANIEQPQPAAQPRPAAQARNLESSSAIAKRYGTTKAALKVAFKGIDGQERTLEDHILKLQQDGLDERLIQAWVASMQDAPSEQATPKPQATKKESRLHPSLEEIRRARELRKKSRGTTTLYANPIPQIFGAIARKSGAGKAWDYVYTPLYARIERFGQTGKAVSNILRRMVDMQKEARGRVEKPGIEIQKLTRTLIGGSSKLRRMAGRMRPVADGVAQTDFEYRLETGDVSDLPPSSTYRKVVEKILKMQDDFGNYVQTQHNVVTEDGGPFRPRKGGKVAIRFGTQELHEALMKGKGHWLYDRMVDVLPKLNPGLTPEMVASMFSQYSDFLRGSQSSILNQAASLEFRRKIANFPSIWKSPSGQFISVFERDPYRYVGRYMSFAPARLAMIKYLGQQDRFGRVMGDSGDILPNIFKAFREELPVDEAETAIEELKNAIAIHNNAPITKDGRLVDREFNTPFVAGMDNYILAPLRTAALSMSAAKNIPQTLQYGPRIFGFAGYARALASALFRRSKNVEFGEEIGALADTVFDALGHSPMILETESGKALRTANKNQNPGGVFAKTVRGVGSALQDFVNRQNDLIMLAAGRDLQRKIMEGKSQSASYRNALKLLEFTKPEIEAMMSGTAPKELFESIPRRAVSMTQFSNQTALEKPLAQQSAVFRTVVPFMTYMQGSARRLIADYRAWSNAETNTERLAAAYGFAKNIAGAAAAGDIARMIYALAMGREDEREDETSMERFSKALLESLWLLPFRSLGWIEPREGDIPEQAAKSLFIVRAADEILSAGLAVANKDWADEHYADKTRPEIMQTLAQKLIPLARTPLGRTLIGSPIINDPKLDKAFNEFYQWKDKNAPSRGGAGAKGFDEARRLLKKSVDYIEAGDNNKAMNLIFEAIGRKRDSQIRAGVFGLGKQPKAGSYASSFLKSRMTVMALTPEQQAAFMMDSDQETYNRLLSFDIMLDALAESVSGLD
jgi:hypothetical protein